MLLVVVGYTLITMLEDVPSSQGSMVKIYDEGVTCENGQCAGIKFSTKFLVELNSSLKEN